MKLTPPNDKLVVELEVEEVTSESGIILAQTQFKDEEVHPHSIHRAVVKHVGRKAKFVKEGDVILLEHCHTRPFVFLDMVYKIINEDNIIGVVNE